EEDVGNGLEPMGHNSAFPWSRVSGARDGDVSYIYLGEHQPVIWSTGLPTVDGDYDIDVIDTWEMTVAPAKLVPAPVHHPARHGTGVGGGKADAAFAVELPGKPHLAIRVRPKR